MQVHRHDAVGAGDLDRVGEDARADRDARLVLLVALAVAEVRHDGRHRSGARAPARVEPEEQLHDVVVRGIDRRLDDVDIAAADVLQQADEDGALGEAHRLGRSPAARRALADRRQPAAARAADDDGLVGGRRGGASATFELGHCHARPGGVAAGRRRQRDRRIARPRRWSPRSVGSPAALDRSVLPPPDDGIR